MHDVDDNKWVIEYRTGKCNTIHQRLQNETETETLKKKKNIT